MPPPVITTVPLVGWVTDVMRERIAVRIGVVRQHIDGGGAGILCDRGAVVDCSPDRRRHR